MRATSEQDVAKVCVTHLAEMGAEIFHEVTVSGGVADIVAKVCAELWIVETKTSLSLRLLFQAMERRRLAHRVFIAAPYSKWMGDAGAVCKELGLGLWCVRGDSYTGSYAAGGSVTEIVPSHRWNTRPVELAAKLTDGHKTHAQAGSNAGGRWTPWLETCEQLRKEVALYPGITLKEALEKIKHHYRTQASARSSLTKWIEANKVPGVAFVRKDGKAVLEPKETK